MSHRSTDPGSLKAGEASSSGRDFSLGVRGFRFSDLHDARRLADLAREFDSDLRASDPDLFARFDAYRKQSASLGPVDRSNLIIAVARHLSRFVGQLFDIEPLLALAEEATRAQDPIFVFKRDFLQRRALKKYRTGEGPREAFDALDARVRALRQALFPDLDFAADAELATARMVVDLMGLQSQIAEVVRLKRAPEVPAETAERVRDLRSRAETAPGALASGTGGGPEQDLEFIERILSLLEDWCARARDRGPGGSWVSYRFPEDLDYQHLVHLERPDAEHPEVMKGPDARMRRRDGFKLTDARMSPREVLDQAHYCVLCHDRDKDSCSKGFREKAGGYRRNPLGINLQGCPLDEKISEAHALKRQGDPLGALAVICIDNPLCPGTGHRICNDCMKGCIFQKQEPVNIPQIETGILTDVLSLPFGFEIWSLLTRWNPLKIERPYPLPFNGRNVLVVGLGPAGYTLALHLVNEGFGVVGIDGLKIEPLPDDLTGADGQTPRPVRDVKDITGPLDERVLAGFGGVSEYGITVRWDKNFLTMIYLALARRRKARFYGGVRFGGTITVEQAWEMGFDHVAIAAGAGRPTIIDMKNNLIRGVRKASDFLMALQLTGAFKRIALANLEARLPAIVVGGGLTAIDSATELLAYYPVQVEKILERFEELVLSLGEAQVLATYSEEERERLATFLQHGRAVRAERERARRAGEAPDLARLANEWGGVTIAYRKSLADSPAYRLNHEEIQKAFEEGIRFAECLDPEEAIPDENGWLSAVVFKRVRQEAGRFVDTGERVRFPARTLLVAAGTSPNVTYEKEHSGTFALDDRRQFFRSHRAERSAAGAIRLVPAQKGEVGFFTSVNDGGRLVSFFGDNHPQYAGNVVKAMASARDGFMKIVELFGPDMARLDPRDQRVRDARLRTLFERLDDILLPRVVQVNHLTPTIVEVIVRAPQAARNFKPGQFFRLQNYESTAPHPLGHPLLMEPLALTGAWVDRDRGLLSLIALELGVSSRICAHLKVGERVVVMGPTGAPTEIPDGSTILLAGGGLGNAVLFSIAREAKRRGCRVVYFAGYKKGDDLFKRADIEEGTDLVVWSVDKGAPIPAQRPQDRSFVGNIVQAMLAYAKGDLGLTPIRLEDVDRVVAIGSDRMMAAVARARHEVLKPYLRDDHVGIGSINSPMQCMMKEVCAQCLQKHVDPATGKEAKVVFSCFNQDQPLDCVDWNHLHQRLTQNTVQEKLSNLWFDHLLTHAALSRR
ncbi:MAG TPA: FAD-dependent oxidoreductase [Candidatus Polarisedimenticolia bacterium]|nr:FAD-dependent oxidoreductase [Candidatus Polarisedimenticolia bacterium]